MSWVDLLIVAVILISVISAFVDGLLIELFSLGGVVAGLMLGAADYGRLAPWLERWIANPETADLVAFLLIALGVMVIAGLLGRLLRGAVHHIGLGFFDRVLGALFGFVKGFVLVTLIVMGIAAFLPRTDWLKSSRLAPMFLTAAHSGSRITPVELGEKIRQGVRLLRNATST
jgi:membrane protein required for colicin V production